MAFLCNNCADLLKKDEVAKHYQLTCHEEVSLACKSCLKEFGENDYLTHTQCATKDVIDKKKLPSKKPMTQITKEDSLQKKKSKVQKGKRTDKRMEYQSALLGVVQSVLETEESLSTVDKEFLGAIIKNQSLPKTRIKFQNFGKTVLRGKLNPKVVDHIWDVLEEKKNSLISPSENKISEMKINKNALEGDKKKKSGKNKNKNLLEETTMLPDTSTTNKKRRKNKNKEIVSTAENDLGKKPKKRDIHEAGLEETSISEVQHTNTDGSKGKKMKSTSIKMDVPKTVNRGGENITKRSKKTK